MSERPRALEGVESADAGALGRWLDTVPVAVAVIAPDGRLTRVNDAFAEISGLEPAAHEGRSLDEVVAPLAGPTAAIVRRVLEDGTPIGGEEIAATLEGARRHWIASASPHSSQDGRGRNVLLLLTELRDEGSRARALRAGEERLHLALEGTDTGFWEWDMDADTIFWSGSVAPLFGLDPGARPDGFAAFRELVHGEDRDRIEREVRSADDSGFFMLEFRTVHPDGGERWIASRTRITQGADGNRKVVGVAGDITERRWREDALEFLDATGEALAASLDPVRTLNEVARLAVPRLADWCAVQLASGEGGDFENIAVAHVDPGKVRWARELQERYPPDPNVPTGVPEVIRSGRSELYPEIDEELLRRGARDEQHLEIIRQLRIKSGMIVPLRARDQTLGAITFIYAESGRQYSTRELELAEELGRRAGLALDHARLYTREHRTAETLQRALLPPTLADVPGHDLAARYLPGQVGDHIGGDWYDAFELPGGSLGIAIGDIGGRGIAAAALMGQVRNALRAYAFKASGPGAALADLRALTDRLDELSFATLTYIVYDPRTGAGRLANAGHLPALVREADGSTRFLAAPASPPLGAGADLPSDEHRFSLDPGATLVLYTDGLVETRDRSIDEGLGRLADAARASTGGVERLADDILLALPEQRQDDVALLALRRTGA